MADMLEHNAFIFWDANGIFPGETVGDAFERAGGTVEYVDACELIVRGLDEKRARGIGREWHADYLGPVIENRPEPLGMIDITPKPRLSL